MLIGGAMAFTFLVAQGARRRRLARARHDQIEHCRKLLGVGADRDPDRRRGRAGDDRRRARRGTSRADAIPDGWKGLDVGPETAGTYADVIAGAATVLWNGPMGVFELEPFAAGTHTVAQAVAECRGFTVVGGGDSASAVRHFGLADRIDHVSTGGGASLELIELGDLPGLQALRKGPRK